jgi:cbb3-type cytochrome oxidase subunit 1
MDWFVKAFIKSALVYLGLGIVMGIWMAFVPNAILYRPAHVHLNLLGFVSMVIFGVAYHVIPRFTGHPLHSRHMAVAHWWSSTAGLGVLVTGFMLAPHLPTASRWLLGLGSSLAAVGAFLFIYNLWRTLDGSGPKPRRDDARGKRLPVSG